MAAPNLVALTTLNIDTAIQIATTSMVDITWPIAAAAAVPTGKAYQVDALFCANYSGASAKITIVHKRGGTEYKVVPLLTVPAGQTLNGLPGKPLYMKEGDILRIQSDTATAILCVFPYSAAT